MNVSATTTATTATPSKYYEMLPEPESRPGDIHRGIRWTGLGGASTTTAITVSPACDLAQCKTEGVTLLPVIPVTVYLASALSIIDIRSRLDGMLAQVAISPLPDPENPHFLPSVTVLQIARKAVAEKTGAEKSPKVLSKLAQADSGLSLLEAIVSAGSGRFEDWQGLMADGRAKEIVDRVLTNSHTATHHLPEDGHPVELSAIPVPSVALLRHPFTIPLELLDLASKDSPRWKEHCDRVAGSYPIAATLRDECPLKSARFRDEYLKDLLSRFTSLYGRLGAPDHSSEYLDGTAKQILGTG